MFVRGSNPIWFFNNLTGAPLDDTYYAFFLTNDLPYIPQAVYQDPNGNNVWSNPIEFQPSAGLPNNLYFDPNLTYRIEIRQGSTQSDPLIWLIQNYVLSAESESAGNIALLTAENMLTNPQFADVDFNGSITINTAGTFDIAPGWSLVTTGIGSTTITQVPNAGSADEQGNPPYYLTFANSGWTTIDLVQTFSNNGAIFGGGAIAATITGNATGTPAAISIVYAPSVGAQTIILSTTLAVGSLLPYSGAVDLPASTNSSSGTNASVAINVVLPTTGTISITNIQITGQSVPLPSSYLQSMNPLFQEISYERTVDREFHLYKNSLLTQPKNNLLVGWTFALNPWQFTTTTITNVSNTTFYTADQTILIQQQVVASNTGNNVAVGQGSNAQTYAYVVQAVTANNQFALIQYIDATTIAPYWNEILSVMVNASIATTHASSVQFKVRLIYNANIPSSNSQTYPIASWTAGQDPAFAAGFTAISPLNDPVYTLTGTNQNFSFDQFQMPAASSGTMTLGIVVYTISNMNQTATADQILFNKVSLVPNQFAIEASPETFDQVLRQCEFYYEKSYLFDVLPGTVTKVGTNTTYSKVILSGGNTIVFATAFYLRFKQTKRIPPTITYYSSLTGTVGSFEILVIAGLTSPATGTNVSTGPGAFSPNYTGTSVTTLSTTGVTNFPVNTNPITSVGGGVLEDQALLIYHYVADARIGK